MALAKTSRFLDHFAAKYGLVPAFAVAALLEATFIPLVIDLIMLSFLLTGTVKTWKLVLAGAAASTVGTLVFWVPGAWYGADILATIITQFELDPAMVASLQADFTQNWIAATWIAVLTAVPDPLVALLAGTAGIPLPLFAPIVAIGLLVRFSLMGAIVWVVTRFMNTTTDKTQRTVSALSFIASLVISLLALTFMLL